MITPLSGTSVGLDAALQADMERLQEDGKTERQRTVDVHELAIAQESTDVAKIQDQSSKIGGFGIFSFILDMIVGLMAPIGQYFNPMVSQVSKVIDAGGSLARRIYSLVDMISNNSKAGPRESRGLPRSTP